MSEPTTLRSQACVNLAAIERNSTRLAAAAAPAKLCTVVKANGYGHGAVQSARSALAGGADYLAVATANEAAEVRAAGIVGPLLVLGALSRVEQELAVGSGAEVVVWEQASVDALTTRAGGQPVAVHVKLDTGMGRLGTRSIEAANALVDQIAARPELRLAGLMTHFATADEPNSPFFSEQLELFGGWVREVKARFPDVIAHAANSGATLNHVASHFDMVRCGIATYGLDPAGASVSSAAEAVGLESALSLHSYVAAVKRCETGVTVGYGRRFTAAQSTWIGTLPIGYGDGVARSLSNHGTVLIAGRRVPIVGTISMDNLTVDLGPGAQAPCAVGAPVTLIGAQGSERITAEEVGAARGTINYEVVCALSGRVPRQYHRDGVPLSLDGGVELVASDRALKARRRRTEESLK